MNCRYKPYLSFFCILITLFGLLIAYRFYDQQFRLSNITPNWTDEQLAYLESETAGWMQNKTHLKAIASMPFHYLDRGKQSYVFASADGKYVLKFFDTKCRKSGAMPLIYPIGEKSCARKVRRLIRGYLAAREYDADNTGLIYVQLIPDPTYSIPMTVTDRFGIRHEIDLSLVPFALQQKAVPTREVISKLLAKGDVKTAKELLRKIVAMYLAEYRQGIIDLDHNVMANTGFVEDKPIRLDVGRLKYDESVKNPAVYLEDLNKVTSGRVRVWLERHFPEYQNELAEFLSEITLRP